MFNLFAVNGEEMAGSEKPEMFGRSCRPREAKIRTYQLDKDIALILNYTINTSPSTLFIFVGIQFL